jgi:hypothetical protein
MDNENIYDKIQKIVGKNPDKFSIIENQIDIELQIEYLELLKTIKEDINTQEILNNKDNLFKNNISFEDKKKLLVQLASIDSTEAYRTIEKFTNNPDKDLQKWSMFALQESRMIIENSLLDEDKVFISTGLGGKGSKLRYFAVLISKSRGNFSETQKKVIKNEFEYILNKNGAEIEKINHADTFSTIITLIPLNVSIQNIFENAIKECNQYGNFLEPNIIITNVKILSSQEIKNFLEQHNGNNDK